MGWAGERTHVHTRLEDAAHDVLQHHAHRGVRHSREMGKRKVTVSSGAAMDILLLCCKSDEDAALGVVHALEGLGSHLCEVSSSGQFVTTAKGFGLSAGTAFDVRTGWDFTNLSIARLA